MRAHAGERLAMRSRSETRPDRAATVLVGCGLPAPAVKDLRQAIDTAEVIRCATADNEAMRRACIFVDTKRRFVALGLASNAIGISEVAPICLSSAAGRPPVGDEITVLKSTAAAIENIAAAILV
jgi:ornithine cyclodeaminase/alanine dehydrogenase-like protein (mu-crystallin family)